MSRFPAALVTVLLALALFVTPTADAHAALVWDRVSTLPGARGGLTAVAVDPDDPKTVWVAGGGTIWVTDDEGDTWAVVGVIGGRTQGERRGAQDGAGGSDDPDDEGDDGDRGRGNDDDDEVDADGNPVEADTQTRQSGGRVVRMGGVEEEGRVGVSRIRRLRIIKDLVYICADQGLFALARKARSMGGLREVRIGQSTPVYDIAINPSGKQTWLATPYGLLLGGVKFPAAPVFGPLGSRSVKSVLMTSDGLLAADAQGIWQQKGNGFVRMGLSIGRVPVEDMFVDRKNPSRIYAITALKIFTVDRTKGILVSARALPGMLRGTLDRQGRLWVGGSNGAWVGASEAGLLQPRNQGLQSRVVADLTAPPGGSVFVWAVGRFGAARLITEARRVWNAQAKALANSRKDMPTAWDVVQATYRAKKIDLDSVGTDMLLIRLSWLLPDLFLRYERVFDREEDRVLIPQLDRFVLDQVNVVPFDENLQFQFVWDLSPLIFWAPDVWTPPPRARSDVPVVNMDTTPSMALRQLVHQAVQERRRTNKRLIPLYNEWVNAKVRAIARPPKDLKRAIREQLRLEHLEADLTAYTNGWFQPKASTPTAGSTQPAP